jgi:hypothetical protein
VKIFNLKLNTTVPSVFEEVSPRDVCVFSNFVMHIWDTNTTFSEHVCYYIVRNPVGFEASCKRLIDVSIIEPAVCSLTPHDPLKGAIHLGPNQLPIVQHRSYWLYKQF